MNSEAPLVLTNYENRFQNFLCCSLYLRVGVFCVMRVVCVFVRFFGVCSTHIVLYLSLLNVLKSFCLYLRRKTLYFFGSNCTGNFLRISCSRVLFAHKKYETRNAVLKALTMISIAFLYRKDYVY